MVSITDKLCKASDGSGIYPNVAKVVQARSVGEKTLRCDNLAGWPTDTPVHFSSYRLNADGSINYESQSDWKGIVSQDSIINLEWQAGAVDSGHLVDDQIEMNLTIGMWADLISLFLMVFSQDGTLKPGVVTSEALADNAVTAGKLDNKTMMFSDKDLSEGADMPNGVMLYGVYK